MTAVNPSSSFTARAQALVPALVTAAAIGMVWQMFTMNHAIGALEAHTATLIQQAREHSTQLRDLDHRMASLDTRMTSMEGQIKALAEAVNKLVAK